jgi:hypothetical protein
MPGVENADVQIRDDHRLVAEPGAERNHGQHKKRRHHGNGRREPEVCLANVIGREVFLEEGFQSVRQRLKHAPALKQPAKDWNLQGERRRRAVRSDAALNPRGDFAFRQHRIREHRQHRAKDADDFEEREEEEFPVHALMIRLRRS